MCLHILSSVQSIAVYAERVDVLKNTFRPLMRERSSKIAKRQTKTEHRVYSTTSSWIKVMRMTYYFCLLRLVLTVWGSLGC
jgi:hypothetical protein